MTARSGVLVTVLALFASGQPRVTTGDNAPADALRLTIVRAVETVDAACVLVRVDVQGERVVLYFVTAGHLFKRPDGEPLPYPQSLTVDLGGGQRLRVLPQDVSLPRGDLVDVAVFRVIARDTLIAAPPLALEVPSPGSPVVVSAFDRNGASIQVVQRVKRVSTLAVVGDRPLATSTACAGAAAISEGKVFGMVATCGPDTPPVIVPFAAIASWIRRYVPDGLPFHRAVPTRFELRPRSAERT